MTQRNPFRRRKSEVFQSKHEQRVPVEEQALPRARNAREFAFRILDEHRITRVYVSDLLERHLDRANASSLKKPPLAGFLGKSSSDRDAERIAKITPLDRRFITEIANGVVRRQQTLDAIIRSFTSRARHEIEDRLWTALQIGVYQLVFMTSIPAHAAVGETVELGHYADQHHWCPFINGVLRQISRELTEDFSDTPAANRIPIQPQRNTDAAFENRIVYRDIGRNVFADPIAEPHHFVVEAFSLPSWLVNRWSQRFSTDELRQIAEWFASRQPLTLRVNRLKTSRDELLARFEDELVTTALGCFGPGRREDSIWYDGPIRLIDLPGFSEGCFSVQDETAMFAAELLQPQPGERVLDLCAAPGTKTTHLAELMKNEGEIIACDIDFDRLQRVTANAERLGLSIIQPLVIPKDTSELPYQQFDAMLLDVPCSNTGVLGKRPEVRSRIHPHDLQELAEIQIRLLRAAATRLKPGGRLVYSTCSIEPEENSELVTFFLDTTPNFELVSQQAFIPGQPADGGYQALLRKKSD